MKMSRTIAVFSSKGGVGKTTITVNLGAALSSRFGKKITLLDCNITSSHLGLYLGVYYTPITINKVLRGEYSPEEALYRHSSGMYILPASISAAELAGIDMLNFKDIVNKLENLNDFIILDSAPGLGREAISALKSSKEVLLVTTPLVSTVLDIVRAQEVLREIGVKPIGIVLNMVTGASYEMRKEEIEQLTGLQVLVSIPYEKDVYRSTAMKQPVFILKPNSKASREILRLAGILAGENIEIRKSFFEKLSEKFKVVTSHLT
ncbi:MAG: cell division ATPase MinD [Candidatus Aenigmarchaeota archaeon]|nr:cell division ATPase MinD [Candidatus Aenigmarchaeota archaeon]MDW8160340.1 cell division ATPase MinD [Candidatus Aenigmarchaeota archaeon]